MFHKTENGVVLVLNGDENDVVSKVELRYINDQEWVLLEEITVEESKQRKMKNKKKGKCIFNGYSCFSAHDGTIFVEFIGLSCGDLCDVRIFVGTDGGTCKFVFNIKGFEVVGRLKFC